MGGDQTKEVVVGLHSHTRSDTSTTQEFDQQLADQYANWLRSHGYMVVERDRVKVFDYNQILSEFDQNHLRETGSVVQLITDKAAHALGVMAFKEHFIDKEQFERRDEPGIVFRYRMAVIAPKVIK